MDGTPPPVPAPVPPVVAPAPPPPLPVTLSLASTLTFYDCVDQGFYGAMYNGEPVYEGAAACSFDLPIGTQFTIPGDPTGRVYVCKDRGILPDTHVDIFWHHLTTAGAGKRPWAARAQSTSSSRPPGARTQVEP